MKPNFALNLTHDSIGLLHRTSRGWLEVGNVGLDAPDLGEALTYLRKSALGLSPTGFTTKVVIPSSQILYDQVEAPGPTDAKRRNQIKKALVGRTPYAVEDLVFDWSGSGPMVKVAVVARETLEEAEQFVNQHKFNAVSFVAIPDGDVFEGEPFFGAAATAQSLLQPGEKVERDDEAVMIVAGEMPRAEATPPIAITEPVLEEPQAQAAEPGPVEVPEPFTISENLWPELAVGDADLASEPKVNAPAAESPVEIVEAVDEEVVPEPDLLVLASEAALLGPETAPDTAPNADAEPQQVEPEQPVDLTDVSPTPEMAETAPEPEIIEAAMIDADAMDDADAPVALDVEPLPDDTPPVAPTFTSRRQPPVELVLDQPKPAEVTVPSFSANTVLPGPKVKVGLPPPPPLKSAKPLVGKVTAPGIVGLSPERRAKVVAPIADPRNAAAPKRSGVAAGGLGTRAAPSRGKPRFLGLILTGILLLLLAMVAAWSSYYLASSGDDAVVETASVQDVTMQSDGSITAPPAVEDEMLADAQDPADFANGEEVVPDGEVAADAATPAEVLETASAAPADVEPEAVVEATPEAMPEVTAAPAPSATDEGGQAPIPNTDAQDEIFLATMDAPPASQDAMALPRPEAAPDSLPSAQLAPPPFGTQYQFDANGRIQPTAEGVVTPEGITLFSGRPVKEPPPRPAAAALQVATANGPPLIAPAGIIPTPPLVPEAAASAALSVAADPALAGSRPRTRPEGLVPAVAATPDDGAALAPPPGADSRLAGSRPRARPAGVVNLGAEAQIETAAASIAAVTGDGPVSPLALAISGHPSPRPNNFSKAVEAAVAAAVRETPAEPAAEPVQEATLRVRKPTPEEQQAAPAPAAEPEADAEPEANDNSVRVASSGTVAKRATFANAINLSKVNLIGVYGTSNARYALIRQSNGRYKKVKVGDRFDGGTVAAITADEVRYQKSGRIYALTLPTG